MNVLDPATAKVSVAKTAQALTNGQAIVTDSNGPVFGIIKSSLSVSATETGADMVEGTDYLATFDADGYLTITSLTAATELYVGYDKLNPAAVTAADIVGSVAADGTATGLELLREIYPRFAMTPGLISAPGWSHNETVAAAMEEKCININGVYSCECVLDIPSNSTGAEKYDEVEEAKTAIGANSKHTIACWPKAKVGDKVYYLSALISALMAYTDAGNDDVPYRSPSNLALGGELYKVTELCLESGAEVILDQDQANTINSYGVVTALNMNGFKAWGNNTAAYPDSTDPKDRWIACRRMFSWWGNTIIQTYFSRVDNPMNTRLIENIVDSENIRGNSFVARGYVAGASVEFRDTDNPDADLLNGIVRFKVNLAPYVPAEDIEFVLEFDTNALTSSIVGGE